MKYLGIISRNLSHPNKLIQTGSLNTIIKDILNYAHLYKLCGTEYIVVDSIVFVKL